MAWSKAGLTKANGFTQTKIGVTSSLAGVLGVPIVGGAAVAAGWMAH